MLIVLENGTLSVILQPNSDGEGWRASGLNNSGAAARAGVLENDVLIEYRGGGTVYGGKKVGWKEWGEDTSRHLEHLEYCCRHSGTRTLVEIRLSSNTVPKDLPEIIQARLKKGPNAMKAFKEKENRIEKVINSILDFELKH